MADDRFVLAWRRSLYTRDDWVDDIYYAIRDTKGSAIRPATRLSYATPGTSAHYNPAVASLSSSRAFLSWVQRADQDDHIYYAVIDSGGSFVKSANELSVDDNLIHWRNYDAVELSNGRIMAVWEAWGCYPGEWVPRVRYALLDAAYNLIGTPVCVGRPAASVTGDRYVSVSADTAGHGILTWMDSDYNYRRNLYYALVDGAGNVLTDPMIFRTSQADHPYVFTSYTGYGNTSLSPCALYLPIVVKDYVSHFAGPWEVEPNNTWQQANGPLISGRAYYGYPNDTRDYFSIYTRRAGQITVSLTGHTGHGVQLQLFYQGINNRVDHDLEAPYEITYSGPAGWYYILIYTESGHNEHTPYTLRVTYPE